MLPSLHVRGGESLISPDSPLESIWCVIITNSIPIRPGGILTHALQCPVTSFHGPEVWLVLLKDIACFLPGSPVFLGAPSKQSKSCLQVLHSRLFGIQVFAKLSCAEFVCLHVSFFFFWGVGASVHKPEFI